MRAVEVSDHFPSPPGLAAKTSLRMERSKAVLPHHISEDEVWCSLQLETTRKEVGHGTDGDLSVVLQTHETDFTPTVLADQTAAVTTRGIPNFREPRDLLQTLLWRAGDPFAAGSKRDGEGVAERLRTKIRNHRRQGGRFGVNRAGLGAILDVTTTENSIRSDRTKSRTDHETRHRHTSVLAHANGLSQKYTIGLDHLFPGTNPNTTGNLKFQHVHFLPASGLLVCKHTNINF